MKLLEGALRGAAPPQRPCASANVTTLGCAHGERFNALSHVVALALSIVGCVSLIAGVSAGGSPLKTAGAVVFGVTMVMLFCASVLYHWTSGPSKQFWQHADHAAIYWLIAGTFTPFALAGAPGLLNCLVLMGMWALAGWGTCQEFRQTRAAVPPLDLYLAMGWLAVIAAIPVAIGRSGATLAWLLLGGLAYSLGTIYYANPMRHRHAHGVWHLFVLAGSASHFAAVRALLS